MIYIVTAGNYSDYHIIAATTDKISAEKIAAHFKANIEEFDDATPRILEYKRYQYLFAHEGVHISDKVFELGEYDIGVVAVSNAFKNIRKEWIVNVYTDKPKEVADKIAYDLLAEARAKEEGI